MLYLLFIGVSMMILMQESWYGDTAAVSVSVRAEK